MNKEEIYIKKLLKTIHTFKYKSEQIADNNDVYIYIGKLDEVIKQAIIENNNNWKKKLLSEVEHNTNGFCRHYNKKYKECAKCYIERKINEVLG